MATVQSIEGYAKAHMPQRNTGQTSEAFEHYARYYAGVGTADHKAVFATYVAVDPDHYPSGVHLVGTGEIPMILDGGCAIIHVRYDVPSATVTSIRCNGVA